MYADDLGWGDLAIQNPDARIATPNLDRLAREGMRFTDAHSSSGICTPSRYALLTGRYHWRRLHGIVESFGPSVLEDERVTLPEMLRERGYTTACIGKWHLGWDWEALRIPRDDERKGRPAPEDFDWSLAIPDGPLAHGFDHYFGDDVPNFPPYVWIEDDRVLEPPTALYAPDPVPDEGAHEGRPGPMVEGWRLDRVMPRLAQHAEGWIRAQAGSDRPFFLYFPWTSPHAPIVPSEEWAGRSDAGPYGDFVAQSDAVLGRVLEALAETGLSDETVVIVTSDNGPEHYAYARSRDHGHESQGPLRGLKRDLWEGGHRVPFVVRWPGVVPAGAVCDELVGQVDLMATLAAIAGCELPSGAAQDSVDLTPLLRAEPGARGRDALVHNTREHQYAIRSGSWVLVDAPSGGVTKVPEWYAEANGYAPEQPGPALYDLSTDLGQRTNRIAEFPERTARLRELLGRIRAGG